MSDGTVLAKRNPIWFVVKNTTLGKHVGDYELQIPIINARQIASSLLELLGPEVRGISILDRIFYAHEYNNADATLIADERHLSCPKDVDIIEVEISGHRKAAASTKRDDDGGIYTFYYIDVYLHVDRDWELSQNTSRYGKFITGATVDALMNLLPEENTAIYGLGCQSTGSIITQMYYDALFFLKPIIERRPKVMVYRPKGATVFLTQGKPGNAVVNVAFFGFMEYAKSEGMFADSVSDMMERYRSHVDLTRACTEILGSLQLPLRVIHGKFLWLWEAPDAVELQSADLGPPIVRVAEERLLQAGLGEAIEEVRFLHIQGSTDRENTLFCVAECLDGAGNLVALSLFHPLMNDDDDFAENMLEAMADRGELPQKRSARVLYLSEAGDLSAIDSEMVRLIPELAKTRPLDLRG